MPASLADVVAAHYCGSYIRRAHSWTWPYQWVHRCYTYQHIEYVWVAYWARFKSLSVDLRVISGSTVSFSQFLSFVTQFGGTTLHG